MKNLKKTIKALWQDESAQGATEYILLLVAVVALVALFKDKLGALVDGAMTKLKANVDQVMQ